MCAEQPAPCCPALLQLTSVSGQHVAQMEQQLAAARQEAAEVRAQASKVGLGLRGGPLV